MAPIKAWPQPGRITTPEPFPGPHPWADPIFYGAQGDGVTDDSAAFQSAINVAAASGSGAGGLGGYVLLGAYSFKVGASVTVPANVTFLDVGATLSGVGAGSVAPILNLGAPGTPTLTGPLDLAVRSLTTSASGSYSPSSFAAPGTITPKFFGDVGYVYVPGGYALTDVGVQNAVNDLLANNPAGGIIDLGTPQYTFAGSVTVNATVGVPVLIRGRGILLSAQINQTADAPAFILESYLAQLEELYISGLGAGSSTGGVSLDSPTGLRARVKLRRVQSGSFKDGLGIPATNGIDQLWLDECFFSGNTRDGIHCTPGGAITLWDINRCNTNTNGTNGIYLQSSHIVAHVSIRQHESNGGGTSTGDGIHLEGTATDTLLSVELENCDLEGIVGAGSAAALRIMNGWKVVIRAGQYAAFPAQTAFAGISLENCREATVINPWIRRPADGEGTCTNELYVTGANTRNIRGRGLAYFGTALDFTVDGSTVPTGAVYNEDQIVPNTPNLASPYIAETMPRVSTPLVATAAGNLVSGTVRTQAIYLTTTKITNVGFWSGTTALTRGSNSDSHLWFGIADSTRKILAISADDTSTAWNVSTAHTLALGSPYTPPTTGWYYIFLMCAIGTGGSPALPTLQTVPTTGGLIFLPPIVSMNNDTLQTTPMSVGATLAAGTLVTTCIYGFVS